MKELKTISDEKLLRQIQSGNDDAMECLLERYRDMVRKEARSFFLAGGDEEDLIQEGMIGLFKAIRDYETRQEHPLQALPNCVSQGRCTVRSRHLREEAPSAEFVCFIVRRIRGGRKEGSSDRYH